jgi:hypothetical protein
MSEKTLTQEDVDRIVGERLARDREARGHAITINAPHVEDTAALGREIGHQLRSGSPGARVTLQSRTYAIDSPHSWFSDVAARAQNSPNAQEAIERLTSYERELGWHMAQGTREGRRAERVLRAVLRVGDPVAHEKRHVERVRELRAFGTGGGVSAAAAGEAAAFVSPAFVMSQWAPFRGPVRTFADQCLKVPLPPFGMRVYLPYFSSTDKAGEQTEGGAVTETAPATELESNTVATITGQITGSQQLHDRGMSGGGSMDVIMRMQLQQQLDEQVDLYVLRQVIKQATAVSGASSYSTEHLYEDLAKGREEITDTPGTRLRPTHIFTTSDLYSYATRQFDTSKRPIQTPHFVTGFPVAADADDHDEDGSIPQWSRFTGTIMPGGLLWMTDDNIPSVGTTGQTQILVSSPGDAVVLMEDEPILTPFVETKGNTMQVIWNAREYACTITRHAAGTSAIVGAAYTTALK